MPSPSAAAGEALSPLGVEEPKSARLVAMIEAHAAQCASEQAALRSVYAAGGAGLVSPDKVRDEKLRALGYID